MAITEQSFDSEKELQDWVEENFKSFFGDVIFIPGNFFISTKKAKGAKPDGFILDLHNQSWTIIETELLHHGVWDHIAEQIIRFVVAAKSEKTKRKIRDNFFNAIETNGQIEQISEKLGTSSHLLLRKIESIIENQTPEIAIFIDNVNDDLEEMASALNATVKIFRIRKYRTNGSVEYLPPDNCGTSFETGIEEISDSKGNVIKTLDTLGGGKKLQDTGNSKLFQLSNGEKISTRYSKFYEDGNCYWYAIIPTALQKYNEFNISHLVLIIGTEGIIKLPIEILKEYVEIASTSQNPDGSIRHYHLYIKAGPDHQLYVNKSTKSWVLEQYFVPFESS